MNPDSLLVLSPILVPMITALICLAAWDYPRMQQVVGVVGSVVLTVAATLLLIRVSMAGVLTLQVGHWPAPFGITLAVDLLSALMVMVSACIGLAVSIYSVADMDPERVRHGYYALLHFMMMGIGGAFVTGDLFNLYVWFEVLLIGSFVLLALGGQRAQMEGSIKYVTMSLLASVLFLAGTGMVYGVAGTLNLADLARQLPHTGRPEIIVTISMLFMVAFGLKSAVFPLFFWLPASYHTPPVAVSAIFSGLLTKVGVYALIRVFTLLFVQDVAFTHSIILACAALTMFTGVLGAVAQGEFRRILSFHIISQIGYMIMGLGLFTVAGIAGSIFYIIHHIIVKTNLFLVSGLVNRLRGTYELKPLGGVYLAHPLVAVAFLVPALSLAGIPPLSGFWAKFQLAKAGLEVEQYMVVFIALLVGVLTLFSMTKIWLEVFWKPNEEEPAVVAPMTRREWVLYMLPIVGLAALTLAIGFYGQPLFELSQRAAYQLMDGTEYIHAVLGGVE